MIFSTADHTIDPLKLVREKYPNAVSVPCCAFGVNNSYYEDNT